MVVLKLILGITAVFLAILVATILICIVVTAALYYFEETEIGEDEAEYDIVNLAEDSEGEDDE